MYFEGILCSKSGRGIGGKYGVNIDTPLSSNTYISLTYKTIWEYINISNDNLLFQLLYIFLMKWFKCNEISLSPNNSLFRNLRNGFFEKDEINGINDDGSKYLNRS